MTNWLNQTHVGDCRELLKQMVTDGVRVQMCVTSPPYWGLRDYGVDGQIGLEPTLESYVSRMVEVFGLVRNVLADNGTLWLNLGDAYAGSWKGQSHSGYTISDLSANQLKASHKSSNAGSLSKSPGLKCKDLMGIPWRVAFALQADGWYLRQDIIWSKPNPMPESVRDRCTKAHEYLFLLAKSERYYYDSDSIREERASDEDATIFRGGSYVAGEPGPRTVVGNKRIKVPGGWDRADGAHGTIHRDGRTSAQYQDAQVKYGRNKRSVWTVATEPFKAAHFATFPCELIEPCIVAGARPGDTVLEPFMGSGTVAQVATDLGRQFIGCELNPAYVEMHALRRTTVGMPL